MATTATAHSASQAANTCVSAQSSIKWSTKTTNAATPAANIQVAKVLVEVLGAVSAARTVGMVPKTDSVVFIFNSLDLILLALTMQNNKLDG
jgi:hypothetical protein